MTLYTVNTDRFTPLEMTSFAAANVRERQDLQRLLRDQIEIIAQDVLVIAEEFGHWEDSRRRIDLLCIDRLANLVVVELKRTDDGGHMELQAIRYAAMVSSMTFEDAVEALSTHMNQRGRDDDARAMLLEFLDWESPDENSFGQDVRIVLASGQFSKEITSSVLWLNTRGLDIRCVRIRPYRHGDDLLVDVQQVIPLPEAEDYQIRIRAKQRVEQAARTQNRDHTKFHVTVGSTQFENLAKRRAIYAVIRGLCDHGVDPEEIKSILADKWDLVVILDGVPDSRSAERLINEMLVSQGRKPHALRYFIGEDELIRANGKTYAFTKMWGPTTYDSIQMLLERFPSAPIRVEAAEGDGA